MRISNIAWNLGGLLVPLLVAAFSVPELVNKLGPERFGILALAWGLIGYAGVLDLGLGRALTQMVSRLIGEKKLSSIPDAMFTAGKLTMYTGIIGAFLIVFIGIAGGASFIKVYDISAEEIKWSIVLLAVALPAQAMSSTYKGVNEAFLNFKYINILRAFLGVVNFLGPYFVLSFTNNLPCLISTLVVSRVAAFYVYRWLAICCLKNNFYSKNKAKYSKTIANNLFSKGGWITVSSVIGPLIVQADRFLIAYYISAEFVSYYVLPYELIMQSMIFVGAISSVMYPVLSKLIYEKDLNWEVYFRKWLIRVGVMMFVGCGLIIFMVPYILKLWLGHEIEVESIKVALILPVGVFFNAIAVMYYVFIQANGRMDLTAKIHILEVPLYLILLFILIENFGIVGAAIAWVIRAGGDAIAMYYTGMGLKNKLITKCYADNN